MNDDTDDLKSFQDLARFISDKHHLYDRFAHSECENNSSPFQSSKIDRIIEEQLFAKSPDKSEDTPAIEEKIDSEELASEYMDTESQLSVQEEERNIDLPYQIENETNPEVKTPPIEEEENQFEPNQNLDELEFIEVKPLKSKIKKKKKKKLPKAKAKKPKSKSKEKSQALGKQSSSPKKKKIKPKKKVKKEPKKEIQTNTEDLSSFTAWLSSLKKDQTSPIEKEKIVKKNKNKPKKRTDSKKKKKKKKDKLQHKIDASLERKSAVVSETLAKMMATQGHIKEAIDIYHQLILLYPEKSSYFADQIKKLD